MNKGNYTERLVYHRKWKMTYSKDGEEQFVFDNTKVCINDDPYYTLIQDDETEKFYVLNDCFERDSIYDANAFMNLI